MSSITGGTVSSASIDSLMTTYGQLDGELAYEYATAFVAIARTLDARQKETLQRLRPYQGREDRNREEGPARRGELE